MIAAVLLAAAVTVAAAPPDGNYTYTINAAGLVSQATVTIKRDANGLHLNEVTQIASRSVTASLTLDATTLNPISYQASYDLQSNAPGSVTLTFTPQGASPTYDGQSGQSLTPLAGAPRMLVLDGAQPSGFAVFPAIAAFATDSTMTAIVAANITAYPLAINRAMKVPHPASVPAGDVSISSTSPTAFTVWYDPRTFVMDELDVPLTGVTETLTKRSASTETRVSPAALTAIVRH